MRLCCAICFVATLIGSLASAQSRCANAKVATVVFEQRAEFPSSASTAKSVFVGVYHNPQSGLIDPPPPDSLASVEVALKQWPLAAKDEDEMLRTVKQELARWGKYLLTSDITKADLILIAKRGRNTADPVPDSAHLDIPQQWLWDDSLHLYARGVKPGLVWCGNQAGGLHLNLLLLQKLEADVQGTSVPR